MKSIPPPSVKVPGKAPTGITGLDEITETGQRLEELTAGEVDSAAGRDGGTFLLRHARDQLRHSELAKQAAILNALPAHIALLDTQGRIVSVNEAWERSGSTNAIQGPGHAIGLNYIEICDGARGEGSSEARQVAGGIRSVLNGGVKSFSIEYASHSPAAGQRWFLLTVTPLAGDLPDGAVVMHQDVTAKRQTAESLRISEWRFRQMADNIRDVFFLRESDGNRMLYVSPAYEEIWGRSCESLYADPESWSDAIHPDDRASINEKNQQGMLTGKFEFEYRIVRPDGAIRWIEAKGFPVRDDGGKVMRIAGVAEDITERKQAEKELIFKNTILQTQQETSPDAILVVDENLQIISYNQLYLDLWRLSPQIMSARRDGPVLQAVVDQVENSEAFVARIQYLYAHREDKSREEIQLKDGRIVDRYSAPITGADGLYYGRVWYFDDITERKLAVQALRESERRFSDMLDNVGLVAMMLDREARITYCNDCLLRLTGRRREDVIGRDWFELFVPAEANDMKYVFAALLANLPEALHPENEILTRSGERRLIRWNNTVLRSGAGDVIGTASIGEDITERKEAEERIAFLNRVYAMLSGINSLIVRVRDRDELFREACRIAVVEGGFLMALVAMVDRSALTIVPVASAGKDEELLSAINGLVSSSEVSSSTMLARAIKGKKAIVSNDSQGDPQVLLGNKYAEAGVRSMAILPLIVSDQAIGALALYAGKTEFFHEGELSLLTELAGDIAFAIDHIDKQKQLDYLAYYDALTGLANRALFHERLQQSVVSAHEQGRKLALVLLDIERFKTINDTLGRPAGDALLKELAARMSVIGGDVGRLARIDADHFAVMVTEVKTEEELARLIEQRIGEVFDPPFRTGGSELRISAKFGIAMFPPDGADADALFRNAEAALKNAKARGERYLFYTQTMNERVAEKLALENQLRQALDKGEFVLHYQPKVNLASGKMTSAEALIRWNDPRSGLVPPLRFIPILEETGLIHEVGRWALGKAIEDFLRWRAAGWPAVRIAVNVSPLQLRGRGFIAEIEQAIGIDPLAAAGLELEITESLIMEDVKHSIDTLQAIRALGVTIAIDDFGTGFSSLSYLAKLPVDTLKIDRSFVNNMTGGPRGLALVSTIISLAHALELRVAAEGVETEEQARLLRLLNCDEMQGFLFSKALPVASFEAKFLTPPPG
jgi:diguanylate cyclase (GGDEF)-like protein/PAS domain S-box-containing protein